MASKDMILNLVPAVVLSALKDILVARLQGKDAKEIVATVIDAVLDFVAFVTIKPRTNQRSIMQCSNPYVREALQRCVTCQTENKE